MFLYFFDNLGLPIKYTVQAEIYGLTAEYIRSSAKIYDPQTLKIYAPLAENIRSFGVKYTIP